MRLKRFGLAAAALAVLALSATAHCDDSELVKKFLSAVDSKNPANVSKVIEENKDKIPGEIKALMDEARVPAATEEDREAKLYTAEMLANAYKDATGKTDLVRDVKRLSFDLKLTPAIRPVPAADGVVVIDMPSPTDKTKNIFIPDNIIIKKGTTVRWTNTDKVHHILASLRMLGAGGIMSPSVEPGQSWEFKFEKPGDYYYICFVHKAMIGKITVEE